MAQRSDSPVSPSPRRLNRRALLGGAVVVGGAAAAVPLFAARSAPAEPTSTLASAAAPAADADADADADASFIDTMAQMMSTSARSPVLRRPDEYDMAYQDVFFPSLDGVPLEGWFIPAASNKLIIANHPMPCNRYGYPGHLPEFADYGGFEVNFLPQYKALHDAGYNILAYDMRNHGRSGTGSGGINGHGTLEYRDVIGSLRYSRSRPDTAAMTTGLLSRCLGANSTFVGMKRHPEEFAHVQVLMAEQPVTPAVFVEKAVENAGITDGVARFAVAFHNRTGQHLNETWAMADAASVTVPTLISQVHDDFRTKPSNVEEIFATLSATDKRLFWIEGTDERFAGYNYFGDNPQVMLDWFDTHM